MLCALVSRRLIAKRYGSAVACFPRGAALLQGGRRRPPRPHVASDSRSRPPQAAARASKRPPRPESGWTKLAWRRAAAAISGHSVAATGARAALRWPQGVLLGCVLLGSPAITRAPVPPTGQRSSRARSTDSVPHRHAAPTGDTDPGVDQA